MKTSEHASLPLLFGIVCIATPLHAQRADDVEILGRAIHFAKEVADRIESGAEVHVLRVPGTPTPVEARIDSLLIAEAARAADVSEGSLDEAWECADAERKSCRWKLGRWPGAIVELTALSRTGRRAEVTVAIIVISADWADEVVEARTYALTLAARDGGWSVLRARLVSNS